MSNTVNASGPLENSSTLNPTVGATSAGPAARRAPLRSFMRSTMEVLPLLSRPTIRMFTRCFFVARKLIRYVKNPMAVDVARGLSLEDIETNPWQIVPSNALDGTGLQEGVDWLTGFLAK